MQRWPLVAGIGLFLVGTSTAQTPPPIKGPLSPSEAAARREATIRELKEDLRTFDPTTVSAQRVDGRWVLRAGSEDLKDFGTDRGAALEAARLVRDLRVNQFGTIPGARPAFEYWLVNGKPPRAGHSTALVLPISARTVQAESTGGTWMLSDGLRGLYDFGPDADAARRAAVVFWKYGFNQLGVVGSPQPSMLYPLFDPRQAAADRTGPVPDPVPLSVLGDAARTSLLLPGNVYAGPRMAIDVNKLEVSRRDNEWALVHNGDVLARFGSSDLLARAALKALQQSRPTELGRVGEKGFPLFLQDGMAIRGEPLVVTRVSIRPARLKVQKLRETWWLFEDTRPVLEAGSKDNAELLLHVFRHFDLKSMCVFGRPESGGLPLLTVGR